MSRMTIDSQALIAAIRQALPPGTGEVGLHEPEFLGNESKYLQDCIETGWVSYLGKYVDRFEAELARRTGRKHAFAAVNGTAALHAPSWFSTSCPATVILPSITFVASANSVAQAGAIPHLVDIESRTLGLDIARLHTHLRSIAVVKDGKTINKQTGRRIAATFPCTCLASRSITTRSMRSRASSRCRCWPMPPNRSARRGGENRRAASA